MEESRFTDYLKELLKSDLDQSDLFSYNSHIEEVIKLLIFEDKSNKPLLIIKDSPYSANQFYEMLIGFISEEDIALYIPEESMRSEAIVASYENRAMRLNALYKILKERPRFIITTAYGMIRHLPKKELMTSLIIDLKVGDVIDQNELCQKLLKSGYEHAQRVDAPLTYAKRGSIVDVFSPNYGSPLRIEFFDDEIDSIRFYDVNSWRSKETVDACTIIFASDILFDEKEADLISKSLDSSASYRKDLDLDYIKRHVFSGNLYYYYAFLDHNCHLSDYLYDHEAYESDHAKTLEHLKLLRDETFEYVREMSEDDGLPLRFYVFGEYEKELERNKLYRSKPYSEVFPLIEDVDLPSLSLDKLIDIINVPDKKIVLSVNGKECEEVIEKLIAKNIPYSIDDEIKTGFNIIIDELNHGFEIKKYDLVVYTSKELFQKRRVIGKYARKYEEATRLNSYEELHKGDFVVHDQYGIGQYVGIERREVNGISLDYLKIIYRGNDELLVPLNQFSLVRKYVSKEGVVPKLHRLGSKEWSKTKQKVYEDVDDLAERLVALYAQRNDNIGFAFSKDNEIQKEFEEEFIYDLTVDQKKAIKEVKKDMEDEKPMDRLLCGDVGFGKTEVAAEAAMKAVLDHKQVAYLCPTTILSMQHFKTFKERFKNYSVNVALLNRYIKNDKEIANDVKEGKIDILIGTHRILSKDIRFKDLGLLIIDEEQRFGVEQKEKIKELKASIDVLSLSATPIPRTLQMSLVGLRGLSTIDIPPKNRFPVQTYVVERNMGLIKEVIERELARSGQVFFLHNNTDEIYGLARKVKELCKDAKVLVAHGKMSSEELEDIMLEFYEGKADVLICTTIIETGIDIPNANTIIIDNAQNFGLSQLYQIKGRVGRSDRIAYAYLMIPPKKELSEVSQKRLNSIKEFTSLGSGYKIAMRDLAIRGAGDMLGAKQSGFIDNVGLDLYLAMLDEAIKRKKDPNFKPSAKPKAKTPIPLESYIPEEFTDNDYERLEIYQKLEKIENKDQLLAYYLKIVDEFGRLPKEVEALFEKKKLELLQSSDRLEKVVVKNTRIITTLTKDISDRINGLKLFEYCNDLSKDIAIRYTNAKIEFSYPLNGDKSKLIELLDNLDEVLKDEDR